MEIKLPKEFDYRVMRGDSVESICEKFNTCKENILRNNPNLSLYAGEWIRIKVNDFVMHIVKPTETINDIARFHGVLKEKIINDNALSSEKLFIGQALKIYKQ